MKVTDKEIKYRKLQGEIEDSRQEDNAEQESNAWVYASLRITENNITNGFVASDGLLEKIMDKENIRVSLKKSSQIREAMELMGWNSMSFVLIESDNWNTLKESVMEVSFRPNPARRVEILKDGIKKRRLGMPSTVDRVIQQSISQILSPI